MNPTLPANYSSPIRIGHQQRSLSPYLSSDSTSPERQETTNDPPTQSEGAAHNARVLADNGTWRSLGVFVGAEGARHPPMASQVSRVETFSNWPTNKAQTPEDLAEAGFYYTGTDDKVRCFYCDGGLGQWESADVPWREHARWFPHCGFLAITKGQTFVEENSQRSDSHTILAEMGLGSRNNVTSPSFRNIKFPISESRVSAEMEGPAAMAALDAGLDAARVRRAIRKRFHETGLPYVTPEVLIDAVLNDQLNEESWSATPQPQALARDILSRLLPGPLSDDSPESPASSQSQYSNTSPSSPVEPQMTSTGSEHDLKRPQDTDQSNTSDVKNNNNKLESLEEENRQLKEARLCKVCMDKEICVVFLPCGHLVSCARCGSTLTHCPLCRAKVQALVRAYLA